MDVVSLLNKSAMAIGQTREQSREQRMEGPQKRPRSRTPWDAGGYSLPIITRRDSSITHAPPTGRFYDSEEQDNGARAVFSPANFEPPYKHSPSDSRSSLSSLTSSTSTAHSRFSSFSTVCSQSYYTNSTEPVPLPLAALSSCPPCTTDPRTSKSSSPTLSLEALALAAASHHPNIHHTLAEPRFGFTSSRNMNSPIPSECHPSPKSSVPQPVRPASPSDVVLIRSNVQAAGDHSDSLGPAGVRRGVASHPHVARSSGHLTSFPAGAHQRSASESRIQGISNNPRPGFAALVHEVNPGLRAEHTPLTPHGYDTDSNSNSRQLTVGMALVIQQPSITQPPPITQQPAFTPPTNSCGQTNYDDMVPVCEFIEACNTGSILRKAISHILGRNKMCTRLVPESVWVHWCRKHYQRVKYRQPEEYPLLQCDLVQKQIERIMDWSDGNRKRGYGPVVKDWSLGMRKREAQRQKDLDVWFTDNKQTRTNTEVERVNDEGAPQPPGNLLNARAAVPNWLRDQCGYGYSTQRVVEIFEQIRRWLTENRLDFPEIELLPNIVVDRKDSGMSATSSRRPSINHRRSQSASTTLGTDMNPATGASETYQSYASPQSKKRFRDETDEENMDRPVMQRARVSATTEQRRQPHRPVFSGIAEQSVESNHFGYRSAPPAQLYGSPGSQQTAQRQLPAPVSQPTTNPQTISHIETGRPFSISHIRVPRMHVRSRSDVPRHSGDGSWPSTPDIYHDHR